MTKLEQLYAEMKKLKEQQVTGVASSMQRHQKISQLQKEIDYYKLGDTISRKQIQQELVEIEEIQVEINRLQIDLDEKRRNLIAYVFGEQSII